MTQTALQIAPSSEAGLSIALNSMQDAIYAAAERNLDAALSFSPAEAGLTQLERTAIIEIEALKLTNGIDLSALLIRGRILKRIRENNLMNVHPEHYTTLAEMAKAQGISSAELSYTDTLCNVIFPFLEANNISVAETWHEIGKSKFCEIAPIMASVITGQLPGRGATRDAVLSVLSEEAGEEVTAEGNTINIEEAIRTNAVSNLVQIGGEMPVREMRRRLRPNGTADIPTIIIHQGAMYYGLVAMDEDQKTMFYRMNERHINDTLIEATAENAAQVDLIRRMIGA